MDPLVLAVLMYLLLGHLIPHLTICTTKGKLILLFRPTCRLGILLHMLDHLPRVRGSLVIRISERKPLEERFQIYHLRLSRLRKRVLYLRGFLLEMVQIILEQISDIRLDFHLDHRCWGTILVLVL